MKGSIHLASNYKNNSDKSVKEQKEQNSKCFPEDFIEQI